MWWVVKWAVRCKNINTEIFECQHWNFICNKNIVVVVYVVNCVQGRKVIVLGKKISFPKIAIIYI